jgi:cephalosporin-C deacetylase
MEYLERTRKELEAYLPPLTKRPDFESFWANTLALARANPLLPQRQRITYPFPGVDVFDIAYNGFDQTVVHGWLMVPVMFGKDKYPCLVHYHGFGGNRGLPADFAGYLLMGMAVISVDCREQTGSTGSAAAYSSGYAKNLSCKGILDKDEYYYRYAYMDAVKALDFAETCPEIDPSRLVAEGGSQGGALGMAVCCLDRRPALALVDVPSNSNLEARVEGPFGSFTSVFEYLQQYPDRAELAYDTLSYFDTMNMADKIACPVFASVGLRDTTCPAKCYFASYNRIKSAKSVILYPFNGHEGGGGLQHQRKLEYLGRWLNGGEAEATGPVAPASLADAVSQTEAAHE